MRKIAGAMIALLLAGWCAGQTTVTINDLNMPTSPAFVLLGKSPASIEKPSNPRALAISLVNVWENSGAIEFTPYWFKSRPAYTFNDNVKNKMPVFQTLAVSGATAKLDTATGLSIGLRTQLLRHYSTTRTIQIMAKAREIIQLLSVINPADIDMNAIAKAKKELNNLQAKTTLIAELAGAYMGQASAARGLSAVRGGAWVHVRYTPDRFLLTFVFLARYSWDASSRVNADFFDYGMNASYQNEDFDVQLEYVNRRDIGARANYDRFAFVANYQIIPGIVAVASLGKDFKKINNVFGILGIKFGISRETAKLN